MMESHSHKNHEHCEEVFELPEISIEIDDDQLFSSATANKTRTVARKIDEHEYENDSCMKSVPKVIQEDVPETIEEINTSALDNQAIDRDVTPKNRLLGFLERFSNVSLIVLSVGLGVFICILISVVAYILVGRESTKSDTFGLGSDDDEIHPTTDGYMAFPTTTKQPTSRGPATTNPILNMLVGNQSQKTSRMWTMSTVSVSLPDQKSTSASVNVQDPMEELFKDNSNDADSTDNNESVPEDDCKPNPCQGGGMCADLVNDYRCACEAGYTGKSCESDIDECASNPCHIYNTKQCNNLLNVYSCDCKAGFTGEVCEQDIGELLGKKTKYGQRRGRFICKKVICKKV